MYKLKVISLPKREDRRKKISHMFQHIDFEFCNGLDGETYKLTEFDKEFIELARSVYITNDKMNVQNKTYHFLFLKMMYS